MLVIGAVFLTVIFCTLVWWSFLAARAGFRIWAEGSWRSAPWLWLLSVILAFGAAAVAFASVGQLQFLLNTHDAGLTSLTTFEFEDESKHLYQKGDLLCVGSRDMNQPVVEQCFEEPLD